MLPPRDELVICFAHAAYRMKATFDRLDTGIRNFEVRDRADLDRRIGEADVVLASGMWHNGLIQHAHRLRFIQSISSGTDQYEKEALRAQGIRLASAAGVNARAVAEHAIGLILALTRRLPEARDNQSGKHWRGMIGDPAHREDELGGKTLAIVGLGRIGGRLARLAKAFDMAVTGFRRDPSQGAGDAELGTRAVRIEGAFANSGFRRADLSADARDRACHQRGGIGYDEALGVPGQCRTRRLRR